MAVGTQAGSVLGPNRLGFLYGVLAGGGIDYYDMKALNAGLALRFTALSTKDVKGVTLAWLNTVNVPGTVQLRIETINATTGKPTGTLYDPAATIDITPANGLQTYIFATLPTAGMTVGTEYAVVLLTTVAGTNQTIYCGPSSSPMASSSPALALVTVDGTTRSNFNELGNSSPSLVLVMEDDSEEAQQFSPYYGTVAQASVYGTNFSAQKIVVTSSVKVCAVEVGLVKLGTPAGDLILDIRDTSNNVISGTSRTLDKDSIGATSSTKLVHGYFAPVTLNAGTYYICLSSPDSANSSNCWRFRKLAFLSATAIGSYVAASSSNSGTTWADSTTEVGAAWLVLDAQEAGAGSTTVIVVEDD